MRTGKGQVVELILRNGIRHALISCPENLVPSAGQYLLASNDQYAPLPVPIFYTDSAPGGFIAVSAPDFWSPGQEIFIRGPLGYGFVLPPSARRVGLVAFDNSPLLLGLIRPALNQRASVALVCDSELENLPDEVEVQPLSALTDIIRWADYIAYSASREDLPELRELLFSGKQIRALLEAQILVRTPLTCGGIADCGVCAITVTSGWKMTCKEGPVFSPEELK